MVEISTVLISLLLGLAIIFAFRLYFEWQEIRKQDKIEKNWAKLIDDAKRREASDAKALNKAMIDGAKAIESISIDKISKNNEIIKRFVLNVVS
jgi:hypothetical protein